MPNIKGTGIKILKKIFSDQDKKLEQQFILQLNNEAKQKWETRSLAVSWIPETIFFSKEGPGTLMYEAAKTLFPGNQIHAMQELGRIMAKVGLPMFYQIFFRIPSPQFVIKRAANVWRFVYDTGKTGVENVGKNHVDFVLLDYPSYPTYMREYMVGYLLGMGDMLAVKNMTVHKIEDNPNAWRWEMKWS